MIDRLTRTLYEEMRPISLLDDKTLWAICRVATVWLLYADSNRTETRMSGAIGMEGAYKCHGDYV